MLNHTISFKLHRVVFLKLTLDQISLEFPTLIDLSSNSVLLFRCYETRLYLVDLLRRLDKAKLRYRGQVMFVQTARKLSTVADLIVTLKRWNIIRT